MPYDKATLGQIAEQEEEENKKDGAFLGVKKKFDEFECPYDALLDDYDPGMTTATTRRLFDELGKMVQKENGLAETLVTAKSRAASPLDFMPADSMASSRYFRCCWC